MIIQISDKYIFKNKESNMTKIFKYQKQKSIILNSKGEIKIRYFSSNKSPSFHNKNEILMKKQIQNLNKFVTLLSKSNSSRSKSKNTSRKKSAKKKVYDQSKNKLNRIPCLNNNIISSQFNAKNLFERKKSNNVIINYNKDINNNINELLYLQNGNYVNNKKSRKYKNDNVPKSKISMTSNNNCNNSININKTFLKDFKIKEVNKNSSKRSNRNILTGDKNYESKKKILINNKKININDSLRNLIRCNSKYLSLKELNLSKFQPQQPQSQKLLRPNNDNNINIDKENINENIINNNNNIIKKQIIKTNNNNETKKERIFVNKRAKNKKIVFDIDKTKNVFKNNSINIHKNPFSLQKEKNRANYCTLNNSSFKSNNNVIKGKDKDNNYGNANQNVVLSYK